MIRRLVCALLAAVCSLAAVWLGLHHPLSPAGVLIACAVMAALCGLQFRIWPLWLLPCLPLASLMPWTGWMAVEEWDLLALAAAAGGYARLAAFPAARDAQRQPIVWAAWLFLLAFAALALLAAQRGVADAGGLQWGWWQGYREPMNTLRQLKAVLLVILLLPLWLALQHQANASRVMAAALLVTACTVALPVWWERLAFTGLTNFSTDYRATGLFWEMHVGGAALDAGLALTAPFVIAALLAARGFRAWAMAAIGGALVLYAALVTFSRIVYLAVPVGFLVVWALRMRQSDRLDAHSRAPWVAVVMIALAGAAAMWAFPVAGYRGMLALALALTLTLLCCADLARMPRRASGVWAVTGLLAMAATALVATRVPKGAYVAAGLFPVGCVVLLLAGRLTRNAYITAFSGACLMGSVAAVAAVGWHWGGVPALLRTGALSAALAAMIPLAVVTGQRLWPHSLRWQAQVSLAIAGTMAVVGVFGGGQYMGDRLSSASQDVVDRQAHWQSLLQLLRSNEQSAFGYGLGRTPAQLALSGQKAMQTGDYRLVESGSGTALVLTSGSHVQGWGELFRVSQRIAPIPAGPLKLTMKVRPLTPVVVHAEICEKHLLYSGTCRVVEKAPQGPLGEWQTLALTLDGGPLAGGPGFAPALVAFSMAIDAQAGRVELDDLSLKDAQGHELLDNGNFEQGLRRWFFTSDRYHMPWHAKNLLVHLWFEQGWLSVLVLAGAGLAAWGRAVWGRAAPHPLAPATSAALVGVVIVGAVDSVFDIPRITFLTLWLLAVALSLDGTRPSGATGPRP